VLLTALAFASGCSPYIGTTAASFLRRVNKDPDPNVRYLAYAKLASPNCYDGPQQKAEAVKTLIAKFDRGGEPLATRAVILRTLGELGDRSARDLVVRAVSDPEPILRVQACRALGKVGKPEDATVLTRVMMTDTLEDCRIAAIDALGDLKPDDPRIARVLLAGMQHDDPATRLASLNALRKVTGKDMGVDPAAWKTLIPDEPASKVEAPAIASAPPDAAGAYPPRLTPYPTPDLEAQAASFAPPPAPARALPQPLPQPGYPGTNPNLGR
jgi:hypothetical protein